MINIFKKKSYDVALHEEVFWRSYLEADVRGKTEVVNLIQKKAIEAIRNNPRIVRRRDKYTGNTPLHWAKTYRDKVISQALIDSGADLNCKNKIGFTPEEMSIYWDLQI